MHQRLIFIFILLLNTQLFFGFILINVLYYSINIKHEHMKCASYLWAVLYDSYIKQ